MSQLVQAKVFFDPGAERRNTLSQLSSACCNLKKAGVKPELLWLSPVDLEKFGWDRILGMEVGEKDELSSGTALIESKLIEGISVEANPDHSVRNLHAEMDALKAQMESVAQSLAISYNSSGPAIEKHPVEDSYVMGQLKQRSLPKDDERELLLRKREEDLHRQHEAQEKLKQRAAYLGRVNADFSQRIALNQDERAQLVKALERNAADLLSLQNQWHEIISSPTTSYYPNEPLLI